MCNDTKSLPWKFELAPTISSEIKESKLPRTCKETWVVCNEETKLKKLLIVINPNSEHTFSVETALI